jgi:hypothetical protein
MSLLLVTLILAAEPVSDPRGFTFQVPEGFSAFPGFTPAGNKLYAFGKNLGTLEAITLTLDAVEGPATPGGPSVNCGKLMQIDRTVGAPMTERWNGAELTGVRMVMTHGFGEVVVRCLDVPVKPSGVTLMVSGKPANEPALEDAFRKTLASISEAKAPGSSPPLLWVAAPLSAIFLFVFVRRLRGSASRSSR